MNGRCHDRIRTCGTCAQCTGVGAKHPSSLNSSWNLNLKASVCIRIWCWIQIWRPGVFENDKKCLERRYLSCWPLVTTQMSNFPYKYQTSTFLVVKFVISAAICFRLTPSNRKSSLFMVKGTCDHIDTTENFVAKSDQEKSRCTETPGIQIIAKYI